MSALTASVQMVIQLGAFHFGELAYGVKRSELFKMLMPQHVLPPLPLLVPWNVSPSNSPAPGLSRDRNDCGHFPGSLPSSPRSRPFSSHRKTRAPIPFSVVH